MRVVRPGTLLLSPARGCFQSELLLFKPVGRFGKLTLFFFACVPREPGNNFAHAARVHTARGQIPSFPTSSRTSRFTEE